MISASASAAAAAHEGSSKKAGWNLDSEAMTVYLAFFAFCGLVCQSFYGIGLSTLPTLSLALQVLALVFLRIKVSKTKNVQGISAKSLMMQTAVHSLRLCSTTWLKGYIPADETGDWLYQLIDVMMLMACLQLLYTMLRTHRATYQVEHDDFNVAPALLFCFICAIFVHPDLNDRVFFDTIWATSLYVDVVAMIPQLWMMSKVGKEVEALTGHYVAAISVSRIVNFVFWYYGFPELAPVDEGFNIAGWAVIGSIGLQLLLLADFMFCYAKACMKSCAAGTCATAPISLDI
jgi:hypothetical protein